MTADQLIQKIKTKGYWRINFEPLVYSEKLNPLSKCKDIVEKNAVELRGWDYPHIPRRTGDDTAFEPGNDYWQGWLDWEDHNHKEFWRMFQSGQFIHYLGLYEDWTENFQVTSMWSNDNGNIKSGEALGVVGTTYLITEIYEFLSRLAKDELYNEGVRVTIALSNTEGKKLIVDSYNRIPFSYDRKTSAKKIEYSKTYSKEEVIENSKELAFDVILYIFERFGWQPTPEQIKTDQEKLLERKI